MPPSVPTRIRTALSALRADASTAEPAPSEPTPSDEPAADPRLASVVAAARRIADGDLTVRLNPEGDDELAAIATALNAVTARFADTTSAMVDAAYSVSRSAAR